MSYNNWQSDQSGWYSDPSVGSAPDNWVYSSSQDSSQAYGSPYGSTAFYTTAGDQTTAMSSGGFYTSPTPQQQQNYGGEMFFPDTTGGGQPVDFEDEPPLLEELGINFDHIRQKTLAVLNPLSKADASVISDQDLAGPLVFCLLFGAALLLHGKVQFGYIYGIGVLGCAGMYALLNLMAAGGISLTCTVSVLGYCLLPMGLLSLITAVLSFKGIVGFVISGMAVVWCSTSAAKLFVTALDMNHQQMLVAYPCCLLYGVFALLAIF